MVCYRHVRTFSPIRRRFHDPQCLPAWGIGLAECRAQCRKEDCSIASIIATKCFGQQEKTRPTARSMVRQSTLCGERCCDGRCEFLHIHPGGRKWSRPRICGSHGFLATSRASTGPDFWGANAPLVRKPEHHCWCGLRAHGRHVTSRLHHHAEPSHRATTGMDRSIVHDLPKTSGCCRTAVRGAGCRQFD